MSQSSIAANRFGYGLKAEGQAPTNAKSWITDQFRLFEPRPPAMNGLATREQIAGVLVAYLEETRMMRQKTPKAEQTEADVAMRQQARRDSVRQSREYYVSLAGARFNAVVASDAPFVERMVHFWANHFAVSADKRDVVGLTGMLEIEAIRPFVLGRFEDMLVAVEQHPAMLLYLDQAQSIGPKSQIGSRIQARGGKQGGLNENLAREILELHTLGVRNGYTQADVTELAHAMTGWTVAGLARGPVARTLQGSSKAGDFVFVPAMHEPGERTILGKRYSAAGEAQARAILSDLARSPATAEHIATKLARHFAGDEPPAALITRLEKRFVETGGDLKALYTVLAEAPEVWSQPKAPLQAKFKTPWEWLVSAHRALQIPPSPPQQIVGVLNQLGQPVWQPGSPAGYDDIAASWAGPDALFRRVEVAERLAMRVGSAVDARSLAKRLFPEALSEATSAAIARAESSVQATALLLVSPEFLRR